MLQLLELAPLTVLVVATVGFTVVGLIRRSRTFILVGVALAASLLGPKYLLPRDMPAAWRSVIDTGLTVALAAFLWVAIVQEPAWLARRLGFIRRSREWEYDVILSGLRRDFYEKERAARDLDIAARLRGEQPPAFERDSLRADAERILATIRSTPAPSERWAALAAESVELLELSLEHFGVPIDETVRRQFLDGQAKTTAHREDLVAVYQAKASSQFRWP
jgi:hypothetical protein